MQPGVDRCRGCRLTNTLGFEWSDPELAGNIAAMRKLSFLLALLAAVTFPSSLLAIGRPPYIQTTASRESFPLVGARGAALIYVDASDWPGVVRAATDLQSDIQRVTGIVPAIVRDANGRRTEQMVLVGTIGKSPLIDQLIREKKIDVTGIEGKWESFFLQTLENPLPGIASALVIVGSDKRGTIYGIYDLSEQIGVSPWYWWADVTPDHKDALYVVGGKYQQGEPSVKYRGIFLNDEKPDLDYWVRAKFGERPSPVSATATIANFNSQFYARIFEVILRMKGNYLWPAMWNNAFAEDDPVNPRLADEYGIVMGTSHQEPMLRAQKEWDWHQGRQFGNWNFATHEEALTTFWQDAVKERGKFENIYTIGLRGENDTAMVQGQTESIRLLQRIVDIQRKILGDWVNPDVSKVPQVWTLYKEVQGFYENGLRVPDDVTLLWAEDNWGNIRRLPTAEERLRPGGAGVYYHFDYHGGPRSYQWINTSPIAKIWEQMSLAKQYGADRIWIVNVGHFKGYEFPMEYFLNLAWDTTRWNNDNINEYTRLWAEREFGAAYAADVVEIIAKYSKYNGRRKPELLDANTYSLVNYDEYERIVEDYNALVAKAQSIFDRLPPSKKDAFYELALFPAKASAQVNEMYLAAAKNALYAQQGRASTNDMAGRTRELFKADGDLMTYFNKTLAGGKWDHFMDQSHIGYTSWADPPENNMNAIRLTQLEPGADAKLGVAVQGSRDAWPGAQSEPRLPKFDGLNQQRQFIDVFNRGRAAFDFTATPSVSWIELTESRGRVEKDKRLWVSIDWARAPKGAFAGELKIAGAASEVVVKVEAFNPVEVTRGNLQGFAEGQGIVAIEAEHFTKKNDSGARRWIRIEDFGHTLSGMRADAPASSPSAVPGTDSPSLEYRMYLTTPGPVTASLILAPTLNFVPGRGLRVAVSFDDEAPKIVNILPANYNAQNGNRDWEESVRNNSRTVSSSHTVSGAGYHTLRVWMVDPAVVVQRVVIQTSESSKPVTYLGPPESFGRVDPR